MESLANKVNQLDTELLSLAGGLAIGLIGGSVIKNEADRSRSINGGGDVPRRRELQLLSAIIAVTIISSLHTSVLIVPHLMFGLSLVAVSTIDWCQHRIPTMVVRPVFGACSTLLCLSSALGEPGSILLAGLGAVGFCGLLRAVHQIQPDGLGMGDVRLAALLGLFIGWTSEDWPHTGQRVGIALLLASIFGLTLALATHRRPRPANTDRQLRKAVVPFGPALSLATGFVIYLPS